MKDAKSTIEDLKTQAQTMPIAEGKWTKQIENQTAKIPSVTFLTLALASLGASLVVKMVRQQSETSSFIGLWVPTFLLLGIYNKLVKIEGNDRYNRA